MAEFSENEAPKNFDWMPEGCVPLADGEYDAIIMGTGLTECIISGLLSVNVSYSPTLSYLFFFLIITFIFQTGQACLTH
jgi:hypothetical protein